MSEPPTHMSPDEFRRAGRLVVDWIARYMEEVERYPVLSPARPGEVRAKLPPRPPAGGDGVEQWLSDIDEIVMPGITHWQSPNFFAFFPANASGPAILGDLLAAGLGVQGMLWATSPRLHRGRDPRARLAGGHARVAGALPLGRHGRGA